MDIDILAYPGDPERRRVGGIRRLVTEAVGIVVNLTINIRERIRLHYLVIPAVDR